MLIDIIFLKLVQHNQHEQLQKHLLPKELKRQPEQKIERRSAISASTALRIPRRGREEHKEVPVLAWKIDKKRLNCVVEVLVIDDCVKGLRVVAVELPHQVGSEDRRDKEEEEEYGEGLADCWKREHEGLYQLLQAFETF